MTWLFWFLSLGKEISPKGWLIVAGAVLVIAAALYFRQHFISQGASNATTKIERANDAAKERFNDARDEVNRCYDAGGNWDRFERMCKPAGQ